jgi:type II secretory pathway pseudopilin PulG
MKPVTRNSPKGPSGFALITTLIVLALMSLLGVVSMNATKTELRMAANFEDESRSFQAAEAGLNAAAALALSDGKTLVFVGNSTQIDFEGLDPNPLAHLANGTPTALHNDMPTVTVIISGDPEGKCARSATASSDDLIGCGAFDLVSTHASANTTSERLGASTTLRFGIARQIINVN